MSIALYNKKRNFNDTPEPAGKTAKSVAKGLRFVIQKHEASHLHYDFRLELAGVMKSWAVPKGPSLNPAEKRLAMHVEDHPMAYRTFEGIIPQGNYGAGTVMVWDEGYYYADPALDKKANEKLLLEGYRKGKLSFQMDGKKLQGEFALVRMRGKSTEDNAWLLFKADDAAADRNADIRDQDLSAISGRAMQEIASNTAAKLWISNRETQVESQIKKSEVTKMPKMTKMTKMPKTPKAVKAVKASGIKSTPAARIHTGKTAADKTQKSAKKLTPAAKPVKSKPASHASPHKKAAVAAKKKFSALAQVALDLGGRKITRPAIAGPQLATLVDEPFDRVNWLFEIKWDGYRALGFYPEQEGISLISRNGHSFDEKFPAIRDALLTLQCSAVVDGEIVALDDEGKPSFEQLQNAQEHTGNLMYYLFDLLYVDGVDVRAIPLRARKQLLEQLLEGADEQLRYSDHVDTHGTAFFAAARDSKLEGIIAKDAAAEYQTNRRTRHWLKIKTEQRQEFVIAGYTQPRRSRSDIGALILGYYGTTGKTAGKLRFAGHVGSGMDTRMRADLKQQLDKRAVQSSPFAKRPPTNEVTTWVKPELVCEVRYSEKTSDCQLRHPVFIALRSDKPANEVHWDAAQNTGFAIAAAEKAQPVYRKAVRSGTTAKAASRAAKAGLMAPDVTSKRLGSKTSNKRKTTAERVAPAGAATTFARDAPERDKLILNINRKNVEVTHPRRIYYPELKLSKMDVIDYYRNIAPVLLPYLKDRPFVLHRFPGGIHHESFYQKDNEQKLPSWVKSTRIRSESTGEDIQYLVCQNEATLVYLANLGCLEMHPWNSRIRHIDKPDWMIFDLDPVDVGFLKVVEVAQVIHGMFEASGIPHYCKTSGKRGLHIAVPLGAKYPHITVRDMAEAIAQLVHQEMPRITSLERSPAKRRKKIYLDYLQNGIGKTLAAPYSLRPVDYAGVSTPLHWNEVTAGLDAREFTIHTIMERLQTEGDLWQGVLTETIDLEKLLAGRER